VETCACYGAGVVEVHPLSKPGATMTLCFVDARAQYGVLLGVAVSPDGSAIGPSHGADDLLRPRITVVRKNTLAEFIDIDNEFEVLLGYSRVDIFGRRNLDLVHPDDRSRAIANWIDMLGAPGASRRVRSRHRHKDGHWIWFEVTNQNRLNDPSESCVVTEMIDISDEMEAQESLRASQQLLLGLTEALPVGVLQIDTVGAVVHQNVRVSQILGSGATDTFDGIFSTVMDGDRDLLRQSADAVMHGGQDADLEISVRHRTGELVRCLLGLRTLINEHGVSTGAIVCIDDITERARLREQLEVRATYDALTGCHNRSSVLAALDRALSQANTQHAGIAVVFIDLDGLKAVNDSLGHRQADALLERVGRHLRDGARREDIVGRVGGDEFLVVSRGVDSADEAFAIATRIARVLADNLTPIAPHRAVASIGVTWTAGRPSPAGLSADTLVARADGAMYESKREGLGRPIMRVPGNPATHDAAS
jgi:diguanylate cyclase (GGDEF)-like protein/PAS domain S-box-containing protein